VNLIETQTSVGLAQMLLQLRAETPALEVTFFSTCVLKAGDYLWDELNQQSTVGVLDGVKMASMLHRKTIQQKCCRFSTHSALGVIFHAISVGRPTTSNGGIQ